MKEEIVSGEQTYFEYGDKEMQALSKRDKRLAHAIEQLGWQKRPVMKNLFEALCDTVIGQQISGKAKATLKQRLHAQIGSFQPQNLLVQPETALGAIGLSAAKRRALQEIAKRMQEGTLCYENLQLQSDEEVIKTLSALPGLGKWSAQMILIFCLERPDVLSSGDFAIQKGLRMLYGHREIPADRFALYKKRYSPYATIASFYLWRIAAGALPALTDKAQKKSIKKRSSLLPPKGQGKA